jgi:putative transposase
VAEKALTAVIQEADVQGISTRSVDELEGVGHGRHLEKSGEPPVHGNRRAGADLPRTPHRRMPGRVGERGPNPAPTGAWPYLWIDATYVKVREAGVSCRSRWTIAVAVNTDGRREVLGMAIGASEAETFWVEFLRKLKRRGLAGIKLVIFDAHEGIKAAVARVFRATGQRCRVHFLRNALAPFLLPA